MRGFRSPSALLLVFLAGCSTYLLDISSSRTERSLGSSSEGALGEIESGTPKGEILARLGPPVQVIEQPDGEVFVYRRRARDTSILNINPSGFVAGAPAFSVLYDAEVSNRDDVLMVSFDRDGAVRGVSRREDVDRTDTSRSALLGERVEGAFR